MPDTLRQLAEAATPGPRRADQYDLHGPYRLVIEFPGTQRIQQVVGKADMELAAACDPQAILALLDRLDALEAENTRLRSLLDNQGE